MRTTQPDPRGHASVSLWRRVAVPDVPHGHSRDAAFLSGRAAGGVPLAYTSSWATSALEGAPPLLAVAPVAEVVDKTWMGRAPAKLVASLGRVGGLIEEQDLGEIFAEA
jgi:hypothetical protein